jgi:membrane-bound lytic murein transglycosylase D
LDDSLRVLRLAAACAVAGLGLACASGSGTARVADPAATPAAAQGHPAAADPAPGLIAESEAHLKAGLAAADEGDLDDARLEFDRAVDRLASFPGGALSEPRVAEAYRRTLETVQVREAELSAATEDEPSGEPAAIDAVAALPVSDAPASPETMARATAAVEAETFDLPIEVNDAVASCLELYQGRLRDWFEEALSRGQAYLPEFRRVFAQEGLPQDLAYVALVESAFKTSAYSRARARGVFQFVSSTGRRYGLAVDPWIDERGDPEKATRAAALYLKDLYDLFGDWNLALAGYNAGEGKVLRGMQRYHKTDYWQLRKTRALRPETKNYVPLIHAAIVLAKAPQRYGFTITAEARPEWESVPVDGAWDLRVVADCASTPVETLRELNPELRRLATPADRRYGLRVPPGHGAGLGECLAALPPEKRTSYRTVVVRKGQTLTSIARAHGVSSQVVAEANYLTLGRRLRPGTDLVIPVPPARTAAAAKPKAVAAPKASASPVRRASAQAPREHSAVQYRIEPGDTLSSIAAEHGTTVAQLRAWNGIKGTRISAGEILTLYTDPARE